MFQYENLFIPWFERFYIAYYYFALNYFIPSFTKLFVAYSTRKKETRDIVTLFKSTRTWLYCIKRRKTLTRLNVNIILKHWILYIIFIIKFSAPVKLFYRRLYTTNYGIFNNKNINLHTVERKLKRKSTFSFL